MVVVSLKAITYAEWKDMNVDVRSNEVDHVRNVKLLVDKLSKQPMPHGDLHEACGLCPGAYNTILNFLGVRRKRTHNTVYFGFEERQIRKAKVILYILTESTEYIRDHPELITELI